MLNRARPHQRIGAEMSAVIPADPGLEPRERRDPFGPDAMAVIPGLMDPGSRSVRPG